MSVMQTARARLTLPRGARPRVKAALACCLAVVLAAAGFGMYVLGTHLFRPPSRTCRVKGATYITHDNPRSVCVGITDGSFVFDPSLAGVERQILQENRQMVAAHPADFVSVVLLLPISPDSGSILSMPNALEQLRGAYTSQHYANRDDVEGIRPYIQLLIASNGYQANEWSQTDSIIEQAAARQHITAVAGLGLSLATTESAARQLTAGGLPVVGATITSDHFDNIRNLIRVSPANHDAISVATTYARSVSGRALLVEDENVGDTYDVTVVNGFQKYSDAGHRLIGRETYDTAERDNPGTPGQRRAAEAAVENRISQMPSDICLAQPAVVLFGGRGRDLASLIVALKDRPCGDKPVTIVSGDDVTNLPYSAAVGQGLASGVTVDYAGVANPDEWAAGAGPAIGEGRAGFATFERNFTALFQNAALGDGNSMMAYDATLTAISAVRLTSLPQPAADTVARELGALHGAHTVLGASGPLAFDADYNTSAVGSNPIGKAIPILRLDSDGTSRFVALAWPAGQPPAY
jgi:ABC-type branched-subunit amino acid transport system substrate-binding protein